MEDDDLIMEDIYTYYDFGSDTMGGALQEQVKKAMSSQLTSDVEQLVEHVKAEKAMASQLTSDVERLVEPMKEAEKKMSDVDHQMGLTAQLKGEEPKLIASEVASDVERQMEPEVPLKEEAQKVITSETSSDADHPVVPMIPLKEEAQTPIASHASIEADHLMNLAALKQEQDENVMTSQLTSDDSQSNENVDLTASFTTDMVFDNREELIKWARDIGKTVGTVIVINKSDKSYSGRNPRICLGCERGGKYRVAKKGGVKPARQAGSKRCGCPFKLKGVKMPIDDQWKIAVACGFHNHPIAGHSEGHSYAGKLTLEEKEYVLEMGKCGIKPKESLNALKERNTLNVSKMTTIYNARASMKVVKLSRKSQMQQLMKKLDEHEYFKWHRHHEEMDSVTDLFWAHPESIKLAKCFPNLFIMDCTYKQNRHRPSLLEIIGVTSTNKIFTFAFVYLEAEKEENYVWALDCMKSVLSSGPLPLVIVTDKEVPLMHAINRVFPEARNLLCRYRISRDLGRNCKKMFNRNEVWTAFLSRWNDLVCSSTEEEYCARLSEFEGDFSEHPGALSYVKDTWLSEYRDCFVAAWTDQNIHFGYITTYRTTSRADNDQAKLRRHLGPSERNFNTMWSAINSLLLLQHTEINASFKESLNTVIHDYTSAIFEELKGAVSIFALQLILMEVNRAYSIGPDDGVCGCIIRRTHGLPCAHEISGYMLNGFPIPLSCVHPHWKQLTVVSTMTPQHELATMTPHHDLYSQPEFQMLCQKYEEVSENVRLEILKRIKEVANFVED